MILLGEGTVITRDPANPIITRGAVVMDKGAIVEVGAYDTLKSKYADATVVNAHGKLIMPGFINAHHHIYSALARGLSIPGNNPTNFNEILEGLWFFLDRHLKKEDVWASAVATYLACIENGVTSIFDHHASYGETEGSLSVIADVARQFGVRSCLCYEVSDRNGHEEMEKAVAENVRFGKEAAKDPAHLGAMFGLHASFTLSDDTLAYVREQNIDKLGYHIHVAEGMADVDDSLAKYGVRTVERLYRQGILGDRTIAGHCIHVDEEEIKRLQETKTTVVHNPESNMGNAVGAPDILALYKAGVRLGLGTDGYTSDMLESYKVANCLVKHRSGLPNQGWTEIPTMLFDNNRDIAGDFLGARVGILKAGAAADVIVMDYTAPTRLDATNINGHLLFGANGMNVITTISDGIVRMQDRQLVGMDKEKLMEEVRRVADGLWKRLLA